VGEEQRGGMARKNLSPICSHTWDTQGQKKGMAKGIGGVWGGNRAQGKILGALEIDAKGPPVGFCGSFLRWTGGGNWGKRAKGKKMPRKFFLKGKGESC